MAGAEPAPITDRKRPNAATGGNELTARIVSALVLAPLAIAAAYAGSWLFMAFWLVAAVGIWWEWNALVSGAGNRLLFILGTTALIFALIIEESGKTWTPLLIIILGALGAAVFARADRRLWTASGLIYAGTVLMGTVILRRDHELGFTAILFLFAIVWSTDVFAYFVGRTLGGPKLAPKVSPNKTWAGAVGGAAGAPLAGLAVAKLAALDNMLTIAAIALLLSIAAQVGDLFESAVKRRYGAKDTGHFIPGHGGFMDRLDGFTAAVAVAAILGVQRAGVDAAAQGLLLW